ncbi:MAG: right-handed parallel beta-helix repeat-containing protein [Candidatus Krumholzibacteriia bacterium]
MSRLCVAVALGVSLAATASADTIRVPTDVSTIRSAVHQASEGDTVVVEPGLYRDRITIVGKNIVLRGEPGMAASTILDGSLEAGNVITLQFVSRNMIVEGLTVTGGRIASPDSLGTAIYVNEGDPTIRRCILAGNDANSGGGLAAYFFSRPLIEDCWVAYNEGGGIFIETGDGFETGPTAEIINTFVVRNTGYGINIIKGVRARISNSTIAFNSTDGIRTEHTSGAGASMTRLAINRCLITNNGGGGIRRRDNLVCFTLGCNDVWGNDSGNWLGIFAGDPCFTGRGQGSVSLEPGYSNIGADDFTLADDSVLFDLCAQGGCGALGADNECTTAVERSSWGAVKGLYR